MDTSAWSEQVDAYAQFFRVISLDLRGAGKSEVCEGPYDIASLAGDVRDLVHNLGERRAHISGFSLGGSVAMETAIRTPELVHTLSVHSAKECDELYPHLRNWIQIRRHIISEGNEDLNFRTRIVSFFSPQFINSNMEQLAKYRDQGIGCRTPITPKAISAQAEVSAGIDFRGRLDGIGVPTLITVGTADRTTLPESSFYLHQHIAGSELIVIHGAGHATLYEAKEEFTTISLGFLLKHASNQTPRAGAAAAK